MTTRDAAGYMKRFKTRQHLYFTFKLTDKVIINLVPTNLANFMTDILKSLVNWFDDELHNAQSKKISLMLKNNS